MKLKNSSDYRAFLEDIKDKKVICFGAGQMLKEMEEEFSGTDLSKQIFKIADNNNSLWHGKMEVFGRKIGIIPPREIVNLLDSETIILITNGYYMEIIEQLEKEVNNGVSCYIFPFLKSLQEDKKAYNVLIKDEIKGSRKFKIPKKIHYCWFGKSNLPDYAKKNIYSWEKYCPDYEIIRWDETNYNIYKNKYMQQAYENKKWGFVPDYARLDIVYKHGGIYLDTDVEVIKNLDTFLYNDAFAGFESIKYVALGLGFGGKPNFPLFKEMMEYYKEIEFYNEKGILNLIASPVYQTEILKRYGLKQDGSMQYIEGLKVYPTEFLSPLSPNTEILYETKNTYSIHQFAASWKENEEIEKKKKEIRLLKELSKET